MAVFCQHICQISIVLCFYRVTRVELRERNKHKFALQVIYIIFLL